MSNQTTLIVPPDSLLTDCVFVKPPSIDPTAQTKAYNAQTINLGKCNAKIKELREWKAKQQEVYK